MPAMWPPCLFQFWPWLVSSSGLGLKTGPGILHLLGVFRDYFLSAVFLIQPSGPFFTQRSQPTGHCPNACMASPPLLVSLSYSTQRIQWNPLNGAPGACLYSWGSIQGPVNPNPFPFKVHFWKSFGIYLHRESFIYLFCNWPLSHWAHV